MYNYPKPLKKGSNLHNAPPLQDKGWRFCFPGKFPAHWVKFPEVKDSIVKQKNCDIIYTIQTVPCHIFA